MDEQLPKSKRRNFNIFVVISLLVLAGAVGWLAYRVENLPAESEKSTVSESESEDETPSNPQYISWDTTVTAGGGTFAITFPGGWGPLLKAPEGIMLIGGTKQPEVAADKKVVITETEGFGSDSPSVFSIITGNDFAPPR